jgi:hypothetical protein
MKSLLRQTRSWLDTLANLRERARMNTAFLLMARYNGLPVIPVDVVVKDFFSHLTVEKFLAKTLHGDIALPIVRSESSQKCAKGVSITELAQYLDQQIEAARKECEQLRVAS